MNLSTARIVILLLAMVGDSEGAVRGRGRPRDPQADLAIAEATLDLLRDVGYDQLTIEGVARRAGVAKATIYRRFGSKAELVAGATVFLAGTIRSRHKSNGSTRDDLVSLLRDAIRVLRSTEIGRVIPEVVGAMPSHPELAEAFARFREPRRSAFIDVLRRGVARGDLRPDIDFDLAADLLYGPIYFRLLVARKPLRPSDAERIVDAVLRGKGMLRR
jgi:AcrR family transcriptional regulator